MRRSLTMTMGAALAAACLVGWAGAMTDTPPPPSAATEAERCWVFFHPRPAPPAGDSIVTSGRALRRLVLRGEGLGEADRAIWAPWLAALEGLGVRPRVRSRWLNAISAVLSPSQQAQLARLPFVKQIRPVRSLAGGVPPPGRPPGTACPTALSLPGRGSDRDSSLAGVPGDYGRSFGQLAMLGIPDLHARGLSGAGILVGILDSGFHKDHFAFEGLEILGEYDFVDDDEQTQNWSGGPDTTADFHGTSTLSALAGWVPGQLIGPAYGAQVLLARTERYVGEHGIEEDNFVAALEWADSLGVDIVSASLGYRDFLSEEEPWGYGTEDLDGQTAVTTRAVNEAARRGILVVISAGNFGPDSLSLTVPADSDSALAIAAVDALGAVTGFSSRGPTADGRIKPDLAARGEEVVCARWNTLPHAFIGTTSGTSLAAPVVAGMAALLIEADSTRSVGDLLTALRASGDQSAAADAARGYGVPWAPQALAPQEASLWVDSLAWSAPLRRGGTAALTFRLRNRGGQASSGGLVRLYDADTGISFDSGELELDPLESGQERWIGSWEVACDRLGASAGWTWVIAEITISDRSSYRWLTFPVKTAAAPMITQISPGGPHPWVGSNALRIDYAYPVGGPVRFALHDVAGRLVKVLSQAELLPAREGSLVLSGEVGPEVAAGRYFLRISGPGGSATCPVLRLR